LLFHSFPPVPKVEEMATTYAVGIMRTIERGCAYRI
jgi:hypothetical protein